jgi:hypothetical protein
MLKPSQPSIERLYAEQRIDASKISSFLYVFYSERQNHGVRGGYNENIYVTCYVSFEIVLLERGTSEQNNERKS